jgi:hypothetical protein
MLQRALAICDRFGYDLLLTRSSDGLYNPDIANKS